VTETDYDVDDEGWVIQTEGEHSEMVDHEPLCHKYLNMDPKRAPLRELFFQLLNSDIDLEKISEEEKNRLLCKKLPDQWVLLICTFRYLIGMTNGFFTTQLFDNLLATVMLVVDYEMGKLDSQTYDYLKEFLRVSSIPVYLKERSPTVIIAGTFLLKCYFLMDDIHVSFGSPYGKKLPVHKYWSWALFYRMMAISNEEKTLFDCKSKESLWTKAAELRLAPFFAKDQRKLEAVAQFVELKHYIVPSYSSFSLPSKTTLKLIDSVPLSSFPILNEEKKLLKKEDAKKRELQPRKLCEFYIKRGHCRYGEGCKLIHPD